MQFEDASPHLPHSILPFFRRLNDRLTSDGTNDEGGDNADVAAAAHATTLYIYGSAIRSDFVLGKSDVDAAIFTDNESSAITTLQTMIHVRRDEFQKIVWRLNGQIVHGYKIAFEIQAPTPAASRRSLHPPAYYATTLPSIPCEIAIYNNEYKDLLLRELQLPLANQPWYIFALLHVLKTFYYRFPVISKNTYVTTKRYILNEMMAKKESFYITIPF